MIQTLSNEDIDSFMTFNYMHYNNKNKTVCWPKIHWPNSNSSL